jgi:hypothetical protein
MDGWMDVGVNLVQGIFLCKRSWLFWLLFPAAGTPPAFCRLRFTAAYNKYDYVLQALE